MKRKTSQKLIIMLHLWNSDNIKLCIEFLNDNRITLLYCIIILHPQFFFLNNYLLVYSNSVLKSNLKVSTWELAVLLMLIWLFLLHHFPIYENLNTSALKTWFKTRTNTKSEGQVTARPASTSGSAAETLDRKNK